MSTGDDSTTGPAPDARRGPATPDPDATPAPDARRGAPASNPAASPGPDATAGPRAPAATPESSGFVVRPEHWKGSAMEQIREAGIFPHALLSTILESSDLLVGVVDRNGCPVLWNRACVEVGGYSLADLQGRPFYDVLLPPDEAALVRGVFERLGEQEPNIRTENHWITRSGQRRRIVWSNSVVRGPGGEIHYLVGTGVDITSQHEARAEARASDARYRLLVEHASEGIFTIDPATDGFVDVNARGCELLGYSREQLLRMSVDDVDVGDAGHDPPLEEMLSGRTVAHAARLRRGDGTTMEAEISTRALPDGRVISIVRDVTERRRAEDALRASEARFRALAEALRVSEAKYRNLYETQIDPYVWVAMDGRLLEFNEHYVRMVGYTADELRTMTYRDLTPERWWPIEARIVEEQILVRGWSDVYEKEYRRKDGTEFPVELRTILARDADGRPTGMWAIVRDVSARHAAERALREGEARYRAVVEQASEGITLTDARWRFLDVNPRFREMLGYTHGELLGMTVRDVGVPEDLAAEPLHAPELARGGTIATERRLRRKDGSIITAEISARGLPDGRVVSVVRDVTERRRMERALRASEERARRVIESDMMGILFIQDGRVVDANEHVARMLGYPQAELRTGAFEASRLSRPEDAALGAEKRALMARTGIVRPYERDLVRSDGEHVPVLLGGARLEGPGEQSVWFALDLHERKEAERRLLTSERYLERARGLARIGTWDADLATMSAVISPEMAEVYGLPPGTQRIVYDEFIRAVHPDDRPEVERIVGGQQSGAGMASYVHRIVRPDGGVRVLEVAAEPILDESGHVVRIIGACRDITEQRALELQLREAQKLEAIGRLAGGVAHDFNNLLTVVLGFSEALLDTLPEGDERSSAEQIQTAARRAAGLTQQLLAFGRRQRLRLEVFDVNQALGEMRDILRRLLGEQIEIVIAPDPEPAFVHADRGQIEQVILNLALNARDAMPRGGRLGIATRRSGPPPGRQRPAAGTWVALEVSDTGVGMSPEVQAHIFEPFFSTKDVGRGTGLGLATVHGIVNQSGGQVDVDSAPNRGSTFRVWLPCSEPGGQSAPAADVGAPPRGRETLLLVEDEAAVRGLVAQVLRGWGYRVLESASAPSALEIAQSQAFDLLVTDLVMPGMGGIELADRLRATRPGLPVLFISGYTDRAPEPGADRRTGYLQKPFAPVVLGHRIRRLLDEEPGAA